MNKTCKLTCDEEVVCVKIPADLSCTGKEKMKNIAIDKCIAPIVKALQEGGIDMRGSCCGHGKEGDIHLQDGRTLIVLDKNTSEIYFKNRTNNWDISKIIREMSKGECND